METPAGTLELRPHATLTPLHEQGNYLYLQQDLVDRQIIDIHGRKVVRVNDVDLEWMEHGAAHLLRVAEVEVGMRGAFRRVFKGVLPRAKLESISRKLAARRTRKNVEKHRPEVHVVDLKDHVLGRAAAIIAKQLLLGKRITVVRADQLTIAGTEIRNKIKYLNFLRKRKLTNPKKGPFHHRSPADVFTRVVRGMLPRYTKRGQSALRRLVAYEGIPTNVARTGARVVIPKALRHDRLRADRAYTVLGQMCQHIGWKYKPIVDKLEAARKERSTRHWHKGAKLRAAWKKATADATKKINPKHSAVLKKFGFA